MAGKVLRKTSADSLARSEALSFYSAPPQREETVFTPITVKQKKEPVAQVDLNI